jgi:hypothetical protein
MTEPLGAFGQSLSRVAPKVKIAIANDPTWRSDQLRMPTSIVPGLTALIDTGSDTSHIDIAFVEKPHLQQIGNVTANFTGQKTPINVYSAQLCFPEVEFVMGGAITAVNIRGSEMYHDVILGQDFLAYFDFRFFPKRGMVELTFSGL